MTVDARSQHNILEQIQQLSSDALHSLIINEVQQLTPAEQLSLIKDLLNLYEQRIKIEARRIKPREGEPLHDITELKGLGKELWEQIDVDAYIEEERNSWDG